MNDPWPTSESLCDDEGTLARRAARLEHTLTTLEALDAFRVEAAALRAEIQQLRAAQQPPSPRPRPAWQRARLPDGLGRVLTEVAILVSVAVVVGLLEVSRLGILAAMGATWLVLALFETISSGAFARTPLVFPPPAPRPAAPPPAALPAPPVAGTPQEEHTIVVQAPVADSAPEPSAAPEPAVSDTVSDTSTEPSAAPEPPVSDTVSDTARNGDRPRRLSLGRRLRRRREEASV